MSTDVTRPRWTSISRNRKSAMARPSSNIAGTKPIIMRPSDGNTSRSSEASIDGTRRNLIWTLPRSEWARIRPYSNIAGMRRTATMRAIITRNFSKIFTGATRRPLTLITSRNASVRTHPGSNIDRRRRAVLTRLQASNDLTSKYTCTAPHLPRLTPSHRKLPMAHPGSNTGRTRQTAPPHVRVKRTPIKTFTRMTRLRPILIGPPSRSAMVIPSKIIARLRPVTPSQRAPSRLSLSR